MGQPIVFTQVLAAVNTAIIAASQSPGSSAITLTNVTSGITLDTQRRVVLYSGGNDTAINFTITGTNQSGATIQDTIAGGNTTATPAVSNLDFLKVTNIVHTGTVTSTLTVGTGNTGSSMWQIVNWNADPQSMGVFVELRSGAANYTVQYTFDDPNILPGTGGLNQAGLAYPVALDLPAMLNQTTSLDAAFATPFVAFRLTTNSGTGTLVLRALQAGLGSP